MRLLGENAAWSCWPINADERSRMSTESSIRDFVMRWSRPAFWYVLTYALGIAVVSGIFVGTAFLGGCFVTLLGWRVPFPRGVSTEWGVLVSVGIGLVLIGVFIYMDTHKWHIGETLRMPCEYDKREGFKKRRDIARRDVRFKSRMSNRSPD